MIAKNTVIKLDKQHFDILGFTAALHSGFTVIAYRGGWGWGVRKSRTKRNTPKNHWCSLSCEIKQTPHER